MEPLVTRENGNAKVIIINPIFYEDTEFYFIQIIFTQPVVLLPQITIHKVYRYCSNCPFSNNTYNEFYYRLNNIQVVCFFRQQEYNE